MKELNYIHAEAMGACEMKHGPIALIASDKPQETVVILFILDNGTFELLMNTLDQMHSRKAYVVVVTDCQ
jgi:glutamine---fructose-6-phosphate transaminase (isomerizing)